MSLDMPTSGEALWAIYDAGGPRPEYLLPVLYHESGFNPAIPNGSGAAYYGLGQNSPADISRFGGGATVQDYLTWPASKQLATVVRGYMLRYSPGLNSGARTYLAEFLPAYLKTATSLSSVIAPGGSTFYVDNPSLDYDHSGSITVGDLAALVNAEAAKPAVQQAIAQTYALRPGMTPDPNPGLGQDFGVGPSGSFLGSLTLPQIAALAGVAVALTAAIVYALPAKPTRTRRRRRLVYA